MKLNAIRSAGNISPHMFLRRQSTMYTWGKKKRKFKFLNTESLFVNKLI